MSIVRDLLLIVLMLVSFLINAQKFTWGKDFIGTGETGSTSNTIAAGKNGVFIGGYYDTQLNVDGNILKAHSDYDGFLARLDTSGTVVWARNLGSACNGLILSADTDDEDNVYVTGEFSDSLFLQTDTLVSNKMFNGIIGKYDEDGNLNWIKYFPDRRVWRIVIDHHNDLYLIGSDYSQPGNLMFWIAKYDKNGNQIFDRLLSPDGEFYPVNLAVDVDGNVYLSGLAGQHAMIGEIDYNGGSNGSFIIVKCNASGNPIWITTVENVPNGGAIYSSSIAVDGSGNIYHATFGDMLSLSKRDTHGNILWSLRNDNITIDMRTLLLDDRGGLIVSGRFAGTFNLGDVNFSSSSTSLFIAYFTSEGKCKWQIHGLNEENDFAFDAVRSKYTGDIYTTGSLYSKSPKFGDVVLADPGLSTRAFVLKVDYNLINKPLTLDLGEDFYLCNGESINLALKEFARYEWQDGTTDSVLHINQPGLYSVVAVDWGGNVYEDTVHARECVAPIIPNVITPNEDNYNQFFVIEGLDFTVDNPLVVFNRWGSKVYETTSYKNNWSGEGLTAGLYFFELYSAAIKRSYRGWVHIVK